MGEGIPEWVFWVGTAVGTAIGAMIIRLGWKSSPQPAAKTPDGQNYIDKVGVLVDPKTVALLAGSIEGATLERVALRKAYTENNEQMVRVANKIVDELEELRTDLRDLSRAIRSRN